MGIYWFLKKSLKNRYLENDFLSKMEDNTYGQPLGGWVKSSYNYYKYIGCRSSGKKSQKSQKTSKLTIWKMTGK